MTHEYPKVNKTITEKYRKESAMKDTIQPDINLSLEKDNSNIQKKGIFPWLCARTLSGTKLI